MKHLLSTALVRGADPQVLKPRLATRRRPSDQRGRFLQRKRAILAQWLSSRFVSRDGRRSPAAAVVSSRTYASGATASVGRQRHRWRYQWHRAELATD